MYLIMSNHYIKIFLAFTVFMVTYIAEGQSLRVSASSEKFKYFQIPGRIKLDKGDPSGTVVNLINLDSKQTEKSVVVPSSGKFDLGLSYFKEYKLVISKDGYYGKEIDISTVIPRNVWEKDSIFPPFYIVITLYKKVEGVTLSFEGKTIGKLSYSPNGTLDNFDSDVLIDDQAIQDEISEALKNKDDKVFDQKVAEALEFEKKEDIAAAYTAYNEATKLKPSDKFVKEKIKELASDLKNLSGEAKILAEFNRLITLGDENVIQIKYTDAIQNFKSALKVRPNDPVGVTKLANAQQLLAMAGDKLKQEAEFKRLMAAGDAEVQQTKYTEAITSFKSALNIKPGDATALARISEAEKLLAMAGEKAKQEAEFNRLIAAGDAEVQQTKYPQAITSFKSALNIKPGDAKALARISEVEKLLAMAGEKAKQEAEFKRLMAAGDAEVQQTKYTEAITSFKSALNIKPGDATALARISEAEKLLAMVGEKAKQEAEFNRLMAAGDAEVQQTKYTEAITSFKLALNIKPGDATALARISEAEKLLAMAGEKAKQEAEFNRLMAAGDAEVQQTKYPEAITSFKLALNIKSGDATALARISEAEKLLAMAGEKAKQEAEFNRLIAAGDAEVQQTKYTEAITSFKSALTIKPGDAVAVARISDTEKLLAIAGEKAKQEAEFNRLIASGDVKVNIKEYADAISIYKNALAIKSNDIVLGKITSAQLLLQQAEQDRIRLAAEQQALALKQKKYKEAVDKADQLFGLKNYTEAKVYYGQALSVDQTATYPVEKLKEIKSIADEMAAKALADQKAVTDDKLSTTEKLFSEKVKTAEENFKKSQWSVARFYFIEALKIKQSDSYSLAQVEACDKMIDSGITAEKMLEYKNRITRGDDEMKAKNYSAARFYYREGSDILKWETYPQQQLKEIDKIVADNLNESDQRLFKENLNKADDAFNRKEYPTARFYYNKVIELGQNDHVASRLKEIESIVNGSEAKKINGAYDDFIQKGEEAVKQNNNAIARYYFLKASGLKPGENLPKQALQKIAAGSLNP